MPWCRYLQGLFALAEEGSKDVRRVVCVGLVQMLHLQPSCLMPHMSSLITYMLQATQVRLPICNQTVALVSRPLMISVTCQGSGTVKSMAPHSLASALLVTNAGMDSAALSHRLWQAMGLVTVARESCAERKGSVEVARGP